MKRVKPILAKHWDKIAVFALSCLIFIIVCIPFICFNSLDKFDTPGLLSLSWFIRDYTFPDFQGWNPFFFGGFPQGTLYPPLFHYAVALIGKVVSIDLAYKLVVSVAGISLPWAVYRFSKVIYKEKSWSLLSTLFITMSLIVLPGYLGFNFDGLIDYGLGPSFVTIPMFFLYLERLFDKERCFLGPAVIFSVMILTNLVAPLFALLITIVYFLFNVKNQRTRKKVLFSGGLIFLLILFWTIPYIVYREYTVSGFPLQGSRLLAAIAFSLALFALGFISANVRKSKKAVLLSSILIPGVVFAGTNILDVLLNSNGTTFAIPAVHPFRLLIFSFLGLAISLTFIIQKSHKVFLKVAAKLKVMKLFVRPIHISLMLSLSAFLLVGLTIIRLEPRGVEKLQFDNYFAWEGRVLRAYKVTEVLDQSRAVIDRSILYNSENKTEDESHYLAVDGLLKESSYLAPYYQALAKNLDPENYDWEKLDGFYVENRKVPEDKVDDYLRLLWVNNLFVIREDFPYCKDSELITAFKTNTRDEGVVERNMYLCSLELSSGIAEPLREEVVSVSGAWDQGLEEWWTSDNDYLLIEGEYDLETFEIDDANIETSFSEDFQQMSLSSNVEETIPVLLKVSYFPKWKAYKNGEEIPIYRVSPNLMAFNLDGDVELRYERTAMESITFATSIITWFAALGYIAYAKIKGVKTRV